jgi:membrane protein
MKQKIVSILKQLFKKIGTDDLGGLSAECSYYLILSIFPFLIFLLSIIGLTSIDQSMLIDQIETLLPAESARVVLGTIDSIMESGNVTLLSFGMIITLWSSLKGIRALIKGVNIAYNTIENRPFWETLLVAFFSTLGIPMLIIVSFFFLVFGEKIGEFLFGFLGITGIFQALWNQLRIVFPVLMLIFSFSLFYKFAPNRILRLKDVFIGALFAAFGWISISLLYSAYINRFGNYSMIYGSLGGIIILLIWLYISSLIILLGGEINAMLYQHHSSDSNRL